MGWEIGFFIIGVGRRGNKGWNFKGMEMNVGNGLLVSKFWRMRVTVPT